MIEWEGQTLDGCTYEEVQRIMSSIDPGLNKIEISFKKCRRVFTIDNHCAIVLPSDFYCTKSIVLHDQILSMSANNNICSNYHS